MGHNRRHEELFDELNRRRLEEVLIRPQPISLSPEELDVGRYPVTKLNEPVPVRAWVRYPETVADVRAEAVECNEVAVMLQWRAPDGAVRSAWVWRSAVRRISPPYSMRDRDLSSFFRNGRHQPGG